MQTQITKLANGLTHINIPIQDKPSATVLILVGIGSRNEDATNNGIAHFIEHMMFKGTQKRPTAMHISEEIDALGADYNAFTSKEYTGYYIKAAAPLIYKSIEILADMINNSTIDAKEAEKEKNVIIEEINMYLDTPMRQIGTLFEELIYKPHPLGFDTAGTKETVQCFTRDQVLAFKSQHYIGANTVIVTAGGVPMDIHEHIQNNFGQLSAQATTASRNNFKSIQNSPQIIIQNKTSDQAHFCLGMQSFGIGDDRRYVMSIFNTIVGGNMSSRLFAELRERRGLCYYVSSDNDAYLDTGEWVIQAGVDTQRVEESLIATLGELIQIRDKGFTQAEVNKAKQYLKGRLALGLEESKGVANLYGINMLLEQKTRSPQDIEYGLDLVSLEQVNQLGQDLINKQKLAYALIGPFQKSLETNIQQIIDKYL